MGGPIELRARDGHEFGAYEAKPAGRSRGGLVVLQEIFGVNAHIKSVADGYAADGYHVLAPAIFDRAAPNVELGYGQDDMKRGIDLRQKISVDKMLLDVAAAGEKLRGAGRVGIVGYCLGGSLAWLAATRLNVFAGAIAYYGGMIAQFADEEVQIPVLMHFGEKDQSIPPEAVAKVRAAVPPEVEIFTYPAGHAFNREGQSSYDAASAKLARERSLAFLRKHVG
ncbi:MAG: dienelactone hydrolase family protein [Bauldia sp.]